MAHKSPCTCATSAHFVFVQNFVLVLFFLFPCVKLELHVCSVCLSKCSWVVLVITSYLLFIASFDWPFKYHWTIILHDTFVTRTCFTVNLTEVWNFTKPWKKEKGQMTLLSESLSSNTSGSAPDTAITDNHETDPRKKGRDLTQSYGNMTTQKRHQKLWLHNNLGQT